MKNTQSTKDDRVIVPTFEKVFKFRLSIAAINRMALAMTDLMKEEDTFYG
tara:strand:+ start:949 stop:1098 length:150 start_codon:yes stop_codon:yes gene_type:complete